MGGAQGGWGDALPMNGVHLEREGGGHRGGGDALPMNGVHFEREGWGHRGGEGIHLPLSPWKFIEPFVICIQLGSLPCFLETLTLSSSLEETSTYSAECIDKSYCCWDTYIRTYLG